MIAINDLVSSAANVTGGSYYCWKRPLRKKICKPVYHYGYGYPLFGNAISREVTVSRSNTFNLSATNDFFRQEKFTSIPTLGGVTV